MKPRKKQSIMKGVQHTKKRNRKRKISDSSAGVKHLNEPMRKKLKTSKITPEDESSSVSLKPATAKESKLNEHEKGYKRVRRLQLLQANKEEDKNIHMLEKMLGISKRRKRNKNEKIPSMFLEDGLDFMFKPLDQTDSEDDELCADSDIDSFWGTDESEKSGIKNESNVSGDGNQGGDLDDNQSGDLDDNQSGDLDDDDQSDDFELQSTGSAESDEEGCEGEVSDSNTNSRKSEVKTQKPKIWEDIYGRLRDEDGNVLPNSTSVSQVYIPPHQRGNQESVDDDRKMTLGRIRNQLKGLINRLTESNMNRIGNEVEKMFMKNSRNDMNETLLSIFSEVLLSPVTAPPRFVLEQSMFIALLHGNIGSEIGAFFLQSLSLKFDELLNSGRNCEQGKECHNVLTSLCHLYNFKVTHALLIFDILRLLVESFQEMDIELILLILKHTGFSLRKDDPVAFKEILLSVQSKAAASKPGQNKSRVNFMLDILIEVRNNNMDKMRRLLSYDPGTVEQLKKVLRSLVRKGSYVQELTIAYSDLLKAHERGRWWIVGSAWSEREPENTTDVKNDSASRADSSLSDKILPLAKKLRINTETRKAVFNAIMTSQDYLDAFERLLHLKLKHRQEREIISVLLHCSLHEKSFNPYYAYLASRLCSYDRRFREHTKFCLWDKFKELEHMKVSQRNCLASLLVHLFTTKSLDISVLKVIHFADMNKTMVQFFKKILTGILLHEREEVCRIVFQRISSNNDLNILRESLRLFMHHFILRRKSQMDPSLVEKLTLRVKIAEDALNSAKHAFKL